MSVPNNGGGPQPADQGPSDPKNTTNIKGTRELHPCVECDKRPAQHGWRRCSRCLRDYANGMRARRAAEQRLQPLADIVGAA